MSGGGRCMRGGLQLVINKPSDCLWPSKSEIESYAVTQLDSIRAAFMALRSRLPPPAYTHTVHAAAYIVALHSERY